MRVAPNKDAPRPVKPSSVKYLNPTFGENNKLRPERRHTEQGGQTSNTYEEVPTGKQTFIMHNRKTQNSVNVEGSMGAKKRVGTTFEARNGLKMNALGDKVYKTPEYMPNFFREGGLVAGST